MRRKIGTFAVAGLLAMSTPLFLAETANAQEPPGQEQNGPVCAPGSFFDNPCGPSPILLGLLGAGFLAGLIFLIAENHHHQVSP